MTRSIIIAFAGDWDRGCALIERSMDVNPHHPVWYRGMLSFREYWKGNYRSAINEAIKTNARGILGTWLQPDLVGHLIEGLRKAGMSIDQGGPAERE